MSCILVSLSLIPGLGSKVPDLLCVFGITGFGSPVGLEEIEEKKAARAAAEEAEGAEEGKARCADSPFTEGSGLVWA